MARIPAHRSALGQIPSLLLATGTTRTSRRTKALGVLFLLLAAAVVAPRFFAQDVGQVNAVDPASGKVDDSITVTGQKLGKGSVSAVFLSDDNNDYKATIVNQSDDKIVMKVPQVKAGSYHISVQIGDKILIKPVRFTVE